MLLGEIKMRTSSGDKHICSLYAMSPILKSLSSRRTLYWRKPFMTSHFCAAQFPFCHKKVRIKVSLCFWDMSKFIRLEAQPQSLHDTGTFRLDKKKGMWRGLYCCLVFLKCLTALPFLMLSTVCYTHQNCVNTPKFFEQL